MGSRFRAQQGSGCVEFDFYQCPRPPFSSTIKLATTDTTRHDSTRIDTLTNVM